VLSVLARFDCLSYVSFSIFGVVFSEVERLVSFGLVGQIIINITEHFCCCTQRIVVPVYMAQTNFKNNVLSRRMLVALVSDPCSATAVSFIGSPFC
jgi:hypothetical protein